MRWIQAACESTYIHSVEGNRLTIRDQLVLLAEIEGTPVGFCLSLIGRTKPDPLFVQLVAVVPWARRRGAGLSLLCATAALEPQCNIALATLDDNIAALALNSRLAESMGANITRVPLRRYRRSDLESARSERHRPWVIEPPPRHCHRDLDRALPPAPERLATVRRPPTTTQS
ncbi:GNAT family N-acetyltransferase [Herbiconiux daphne]|uniref:GNAT family N-acetyltransferase n=1 Tax=Herbiconiux daphne TaxID=2970914 RepID=UPI0038B3618A